MKKFSRLIALCVALGPTPSFAQAIIVPSPVPALAANCVLQYNASTQLLECNAIAAVSQPLTDSVGLIANGSKILKFNVAAIASSTTRTWTIPDANITIPSTVASLAANTFTGLQTLNGGVAATTGAFSSLLTLSKTTDTTNARDFLYFQNGTYSTASMGFQGYNFYLSKTDNTADGLVFDISTGNVGIGTVSPGSLVDIYGATPYVRLRTTATSGADSVAHWQLLDSGNNGWEIANDVTVSPKRLNVAPMTAGSVGTSALKIGADGTILVSAGLSASSTGDVYVCMSTSYELRVGATCLASAARFKRDIQPTAHGLDWVMRMRPSTFIFRDSGLPGLGFIADDLAQVDPSLALFQGGEVYSVADRAVLATLVRAVQEQQATIDRLQQR